MRIFGKRQKKEEPQLLLTPQQEAHRYDLVAMFLKAALVFLIGYGAIAGFMSAYHVEYNNGLCMAEIFLFALILCALHETGKKWVSDLTDIVSFLGYLFLSLNSRMTVNSGYYVIVNKILEEAREYLGIVRGTEYGVTVEDEYSAVTAFVLFIGIAVVMLLTMHVQHKIHLIRIVLLTLPLYGIPFYFEKSPKPIYMILLFSGYVAAALLQSGNACGKADTRIKNALPLATVIVAVAATVFGLFLPVSTYKRLIPVNEKKKATEKNAANVVQFGLAALFQHNIGAGISGGKLSSGAALIPDYETDLIVRYTPYDYKPVYLKAFTGKEYLGDRWSDAGADGDLKESAEARENLWQRREDLQGRGIIEVENIGASFEYEYIPYYADKGASSWTGNAQVFAYYPRTGTDPEIRETPDDGYLTVPDRCLRAVQRVCITAGFWGTAEEIAEQIVAYFDENYRYTLRPGYYYGNRDYITNFLINSQKGYCMHFASAAVMLFRYMGIPARYAEGYAFSYTDVVLDGQLQQDAVYADYYSGYSPIGETALIELEIPDANAHAWVEIYVDGKGWIIVDPTPSSMQDDEESSFWEDFLGGNSLDGTVSFGQNNIGTYVEKVAQGMIYALLAFVLAVAVFFGVRGIRRAGLEKKLPEKERVRLAYGRIVRRAGQKSGEFGRLRTVREQTGWLREHYGLLFSEEQERALYEIFFAKQVQADCRQIRKDLGKLHRRLRFARRGRARQYEERSKENSDRT